MLWQRSWTHEEMQDTEFPGIVARPIGDFKTGSDYHYQTMRCNVDMLRIIQLGISLSDEEGNTPEVSTWQFNFSFNLKYVELLSSFGLLPSKTDLYAVRTCTHRILSTC